MSAPPSRAKRPNSAATDASSGSRLLSDAMRFARSSSAPQNAQRSASNSGRSQVSAKHGKPSDRRSRGLAFQQKRRSPKAAAAAAAASVKRGNAKPRGALRTSPRSAARDIVAAAASPGLSPSKRQSPRSPANANSPKANDQEDADYDDVNPFAGLVSV